VIGLEDVWIIVMWRLLEVDWSCSAS